MENKQQFSLAFIFQQIFWIAVLLGIGRVFPMVKLEGLSVSDAMQVLRIQWSLIIFVGPVAGALLGGFRSNVKWGAIIGLCVSFPLATLWLLLWLSAMAGAG
jgi:hypothetical protein